MARGGPGGAADPGGQIIFLLRLVLEGAWPTVPVLMTVFRFVPQPGDEMKGTISFDSPGSWLAFF